MFECCGSSIPLYTPRPGWALNASTTFVSSCSFGDPAVVGRFGSAPSQSQQWRPCAAAASSSFFSAVICPAICCASQSARPVRTKLAPPALSSCQASLPSGIFPPAGGGSDRPSGKTFCPPTTRAPVASMVTLVIRFRAYARAARLASARPCSWPRVLRLNQYSRRGSLGSARCSPHRGRHGTHLVRQVHRGARTTAGSGRPLPHCEGRSWIGRLRRTRAPSFGYSLGSLSGHVGGLRRFLAGRRAGARPPRDRRRADRRRRRAGLDPPLAGRTLL